MLYSEDCKFIYVFSEKARDEVLKMGYKLIKSIPAQNAYIFENDRPVNFGKSDENKLNRVKHVKTNMLTF